MEGIMNTIKCTICGEEKEYRFFKADKNFPTGHINQCKECNSQQDWYKNGKKAYNASKKGLEAKKRYRLKNKEKVIARDKVGGALRFNKIKKLPCVVCGLEKVEAHHADYLKLLDVVWLCKTHHMELHYFENLKGENQ